MALPASPGVPPPRPRLRVVPGGSCVTLRRRRRLAGIVVGVALLAGVGRAAGQPRGAGRASVNVAVREGDTLWTLAERFGPAGADPRRVVDAIRARNGLEGESLAPGQSLSIP